MFTKDLLQSGGFFFNVLAKYASISCKKYLEKQYLCTGIGGLCDIV